MSDPEYADLQAFHEGFINVIFSTGLTAEDLAERTGLSFQDLSERLTLPENLTIDTVMRVSRALGLSTMWTIVPTDVFPEIRATLEALTQLAWSVQRPRVDTEASEPVALPQA